MIEEWKKVINEIQSLIDETAVVINGLRNGKDVGKIKNQFNKRVKSVSKSVDDFGSYVKDPEAATVELPFDSEAFKTAWEFYKVYLHEVHGFGLENTVEIKRLSMLFKFAGKDEKTAIEMLDYFIATRSKTIFKPDSKLLTGDTASDDSISSAFSLQKQTL